jgi:hypothetical protein
MKQVICINDYNLPLGANITKDTTYTVIQEYLNMLDQKVYILKETINEGYTKMGMKWTGYNAERFAEINIMSAALTNYEMALN